MSSISDIGSSILKSVSSSNAGGASNSNTNISATNSTTTNLQNELTQLEKELAAEEANKTDSAQIKQQKDQALQMQIADVNAELEAAENPNSSSASTSSESLNLVG